MNDCIEGLRLWLIALILRFLSIFFPFLFYMLTLKMCVRVFSNIIQARNFKLGIHMDNELNHGIKNEALCLYPSLYLSFFLSFQGEFVS